MKLINRKLMATAAGALWAMLANVSANAEDIELFVGNVQGSTDARPNVLLILDDSGSMNAEVESQVDYDPSQDYSGNCLRDRVYWTSDNSPPPTDNQCSSTDRYIERDALVCEHAFVAFAAEDGGRYNGRMVQYDPNDREWEELSRHRHDWYVECEDDEGDHGLDSSSTRVYPQDDANNPWTSDEDDSIWAETCYLFGLICYGGNPGDRYLMHDGNYVNWYNGASVDSDRLEIMQEVANNLINSVNGVNIGLMSFNRNVSWDDHGGLVRQAIEDVSTSRSSLISTVNNLDHDGNTPLSETLYEAHQYLRGASVVYGDVWGSDDDARAPGDSDRYRSPIEYTCQKSHIVLLTDGEPTRDYDADNEIESLSDAEGSTFSSLTGNSGCDGHGNGHCLDDLAAFMYEGDLSSSLDGQQNVATHTVGFFTDFDLLEQTAQRGGGDYYVANDTGSLTSALTSIISEVLETQSTFVAPAVSVNAFNQTRNLNDLYFSVFQPSGTSHWPGNLKRYRLRPSDATIIDANGNPAVDEDEGFFDENAQSFWSGMPDGRSVEQGGAANQIPTPRTVFTYLGSDDLTASTNEISTANMDIQPEMLGANESGGPTRDEVIAFMNGLDPTDIDNNGVTDEPSPQPKMGDPLHSRPATVIYGPDNEDGRIYFATNDGYLHSIDTETGVEQWAFVPPEFLGNQAELMLDDGTDDKIYGIDGNIAVQTTADRDNVIDGDEKVYIFFGMRRGGEFYYGLDVSNPDQPELLWRLDPADFPGTRIEQSWSTPVPARIEIEGVTQNDDNMVLVIGGGYDPNQDDPTLSPDSSGNAIYIVDSETGDLLWHASDEGADLNLSKDNNDSNATMEYSIPADVEVVDINSDGFADRLYAADMGGQVWRFDIFNGESIEDDVITGGAIAQLGGGHLDSPSLADTRRFYNTPDTAFVSNDEQTFMHIGIGSGYRSHPNSTDHEDRFYAIRDYSAFTWRSQSEFAAIEPFVDSDFEDVSDDIDADIPPGDPGWKFELLAGEKVLAEAVTFDGEVFFSTFRPGGTANACNPSLGFNRQYRVGLLTGSPVTNLHGEVDEDGDGEPDPLTEEDRFTQDEGSILSRTTVIFADDDDGEGGEGGGPGARAIGCTETDCSDLDFDPSPRRTFWTQESVE